MGQLFERVCIVGVGLIGGSMGLAVRSREKTCRVVGVGHRKTSIDRALETGAIDEGTLDAAEGIKDADLVVLATAVGLIARLGKEIASSLPKGCIVTDVGSTKSEIVASLEAVLPAGVHFVGGHPIAGSEQRGIDAARADLFQGKVCVLTPTPRTDPHAMRRLADFWTALGARVVTLSPVEHDATLARTSHLPHVAAAALIASLRSPDTAFAGTGLRDTTRVASGDVELWCDILLTNRDAVLDAMNVFTAEMEELRRAVETGDRKQLASLLAAARARRDELWSNDSPSA